MNDFESQVAHSIHELEKLLQESLEWKSEVARLPEQARQRHNRWADQRQSLFLQHLQEARNGLQISVHVKHQPRPPAGVVQAWTPEAVGAGNNYLVETDHARSKVGAIFASRASTRLLELEQAWDAQLESLYKLVLDLSRR